MERGRALSPRRTSAPSILTKAASSAWTSNRQRAGHTSARHGPEAGEDVAPLPLEEIAPRAPDQARARRPASALEHVLLAEMRLGILLVRVAHEPGIRLERVGHPLPHVADHLPAADRTVAGRQRAHVERSAGAVVEIGARGRRRRVAPGETPLAARGRVERGRHLPLRLGGEPPARPAAERLRLVPVHVHDRVPRLEGPQQVEAALAPATAGALPEQRMLGALAAAPVPAAPSPALATPIAAVVDEALELRVGDGRRGDPERLDLDGVRPLLVVEDERLVGFGAPRGTAAGGGDVARAETGIDGGRRRGRGGEAWRPRGAQRLEDRRQGLALHVLLQPG